MELKNRFIIKILFLCQLTPAGRIFELAVCTITFICDRLRELLRVLMFPIPAWQHHAQRETQREREHRYESNFLVYENRCASVSTGCQLSDRNVGWTCHVTYSFTFGDNTRSTNIREIRSHTHAHSTHTKMLDTDTKPTYKRQAR